jgi:hypothetical protein
MAIRVSVVVATRKIGRKRYMVYDLAGIFNPYHPICLITANPAIPTMDSGFLRPGLSLLIARGIGIVAVTVSGTACIGSDFPLDDEVSNDLADSLGTLRVNLIRRELSGTKPISNHPANRTDTSTHQHNFKSMQRYWLFIPWGHLFSGMRSRIGHAARETPLPAFA